jgi:hypothetical protein
LPGCTELLSKLFADDTALINEDDNLDRLLLKTNSEFQKVCRYFRMNKLSLHPDKTKFLIISNSTIVRDTPASIYINNNKPGQNNANLIYEIKRINIQDSVPAIKYLGVYFDPGLSFKYHCNQLSTKLSKALYHLRCVKHVLPPEALKSLYFALLHSHLTYSIEIWGAAPQNVINELYLKQKAAIRIITNSKYNAHTAPLFRKLNILPLPLLIQYSFINIVHRHHHNKLPQGLWNMWRTVRSRLDIADARTLRNEGDYICPFVRTDQLLRFPYALAPKFWNDLPLDLKNISNFNTFQANLKTHLLSNLTTNCTRLFCHACSEINPDL